MPVKSSSSNGPKGWPKCDISTNSTMFSIKYLSCVHIYRKQYKSTHTHTHTHTHKQTSAKFHCSVNILNCGLASLDQSCSFKKIRNQQSIDNESGRVLIKHENNREGQSSADLARHPVLSNRSSVGHQGIKRVLTCISPSHNFQKLLQ